MDQDDVLILGAGAAGLMCAAVAARRGRRVRILEHAARPGGKILISGGGSCNFTNLFARPENYLSQQPEFCRSALARYGPGDFVALVEAHGIAYHEKKLGQLFCDHSSRDILNLLLEECGAARLHCEAAPDAVTREGDGRFAVRSGGEIYSAESLVVATGGLSFPRLGATDFAYRVARQFGLRIVEPRPGLVPVTCDGETGAMCKELSGIAVPCRAQARVPGAPAFVEALLFTHRGLSGPAVLQASSYLPPVGGEIVFDLLPDAPPGEPWLTARHAAGETAPLHRVLAERLPGRVAEAFAPGPARPLRQHAVKELAALERRLRRWVVKPAGTEGYGKAEVTLGGIDTREIESRTMEARAVRGLYFIGEAVDVTGHLGGFNFQWAWASAQAAGEVV